MTEIEENNKLIVEFLEYRRFTKKIELGKSEPTDNILIMDNWYKVGDLEYQPLSMKYHKSWDWLIPVVEKIESLGYSTELYYNHIRNYNLFTITNKNLPIGGIAACRTTSKIEAVYNTVVLFIKWYNKHGKEN